MNIQTKKHKIDLLKGISTGRATTNDLDPLGVQMWTKEAGIWENEKTGEKLNDEQFEKMEQSAKKSNTLIFKTVYPNEKKG